MRKHGDINCKNIVIASKSDLSFHFITLPVSLIRNFNLHPAAWNHHIYQLQFQHNMNQLVVTLCLIHSYGSQLNCSTSLFFCISTCNYDAFSNVNFLVPSNYTVIDLSRYLERLLPLIARRVLHTGIVLTGIVLIDLLFI